MMKTISGGVCAAKGFTASGVHCGIRKNRTKKDIALIYSEVKARRRQSSATAETPTPATQTALRSRRR